ncbi:MAG: acyl-CoA dehydratase activase [Deltaproteobacteria bacterium]|nr:acyl-CoA dehydratase activase [Deltaproteobacteria bacterium]
MDKVEYFVGLDIGSTTAKVAVLNSNRGIVCKAYRRHNAEIIKTTCEIIDYICSVIGNERVAIRITGTAGMGIAERVGIPFVQEVIASCETVKTFYPEVKTLIDIGGEDSKLIIFSSAQPDIRMNGNCAGGTGSFIDQMCKILNISYPQLNDFATGYKRLYPISSRCGVFAKTDIQTMISRRYDIEDICASVFQAVAIQTINSLARGSDICPKVLFSGGPLSFLPALRDTFKRVLNMNDDDIILPDFPELVVSIGTALIESEYLSLYLFDLKKLLLSLGSYNYNIKRRLDPLLEEDETKENYMKGINVVKLRTSSMSNASPNCFLGIDSGSTTTKVVLINMNSQIVADSYIKNAGNPIKALKEGLRIAFSNFYEKTSQEPRILYSAVTGYGEELIRSAFHVDCGIVETMAHYKAASRLNREVSFVLDIGGQDMKAMFIDKGFLNNLVINEACSSGCGSFLSSFADSLGIAIEEFAEMALKSKSPCDLGTRCTVFMGSKIKQALKEGASIYDISAGLAYSVVKNCLYKMLRLRDPSELGENVVVQGGTFKNLAILKAFERETGKKVFISDVPELMGAYGAALYAREIYEREPKESSFLLRGYNEISYKIDYLRCGACEIKCEITKYSFDNGRKYYNGNRCERVYSNRTDIKEKGFNFAEFKNKLLFEFTTVNNSIMKVGIPRILGMYENFIFFRELFQQCGLGVIISDLSTSEIYNKGLGTIMSDNICFPAKLAHGHIINLIEKGVDRIFYPIMIYERKKNDKSINSYNCPIVSSYADVLKSSIDPWTKYKIRFDSPPINFKDESLLKASCYEYLSALGVGYTTFSRAYEAAQEAYLNYRRHIVKKAREIIEKCYKEGRSLFVFAQRPYHIDPLINQNVAKIVSDIGIDSITEDALEDEDISFEEIFIIPQWAYINRIIKAAKWVNEQPIKTCLLQINSFGCGPDSFVVDETREIVNRGGRYHLLIRIDEFSNTGAIKLRLLSLKEALNQNSEIKKRPFVDVMCFDKKDKERKILVPHFSDIYSPFIPPAFKSIGINIEVLPPADYKCVEYGLKYVNNEVCYPAIIVIGSLIKALLEGDYDLSRIAVALTQTGGQCRASNYIPLLKKALVAAGLENVPVVSIGFEGDISNNQPGFGIDWKRFIKIAFITGLYADALSRMYYANVAREEKRGESKSVLNRFIEASGPYIEKENYDGLIALLNNSVDAFNRVRTKCESIPKIGVVGEIFLKYNDFSNNNIIEWLITQGVEVVTPQIADFFMQFFVNIKVNTRSYIEKPSIRHLIAIMLEVIATQYINKIEKILTRYKYYTPSHDIFTKAYKAKRVIELVNQFGEGWLIPAEICAYAESGIKHVISLQPFGCIANHVVSKGIEKNLKKYYPDLNLLFLDFDSCASEVNIFNRLYFMVRGAREYNIQRCSRLKYPVVYCQ